MQNMNKWAVCLDLTKMDDLLIGYVDYLANVIKPEEIRFVHIMETNTFDREINEIFPELENEDDLANLVEEKIKGSVDEHFNHKDIKVSFGIRKGSATNQIIKMMEEQQPDLLVLGKKNTYIGEGVASRRLVKYVPCSILFIPETARYLLNHITVPVDFSEQSANAVKLANALVSKTQGSVTAQHIYQYPKQFFPYMPDESAIKEMDEYLEKQKAEYIKEYSLPKDQDIDLTLHREGKMSDEIYDLCVHKKTDLIIVAYKAQNSFIAALKDNLADRMTNYRFGLPVLVAKNKEKNLKFFERLIS